MYILLTPRASKVKAEHIITLSTPALTLFSVSPSDIITDLPRISRVNVIFFHLQQKVYYQIRLRLPVYPLPSCLPMSWLS